MSSISQITFFFKYRLRLGPCDQSGQYFSTYFKLTTAAKSLHGKFTNANLVLDKFVFPSFQVKFLKSL